MKILLMGEFSGYHTALKHGLEELGMECVLASNGDNWKKISGSNIRLFRTDFKNPVDKALKLVIEPLFGMKKFYGYDVVQYVNPIIYSTYVNKIIFDKIRHHSTKLFTAVSGDCYSLYDAYKKGKLGYYIYDDNPGLCASYTNDKHAKARISQEEYTYNHVDGIIPVMYEYAIGVKNRNNCLPTIPLPFESYKIDYQENKVDGKLVIMHGVIREKYKGTAYILKAFDIIKEKYPNDVEIIVDGKLPLAEYLKVLQRTNILVDQCKEHGWSMNACFGMAQGKVVLSGASRNTLKEFGLTKSPIIHIKPDVNQIVSQLEYLIENRDKIEEFGYESRKFVENFHDHRRIAQLYLDSWNNVGKT